MERARGDHFFDPAHAARASAINTNSPIRYWVSWVASAMPVKTITTSGGIGQRGILNGRASSGMDRLLQKAARPMQKYTAAITVPEKMIRNFSADVNTSTQPACQAERFRAGTRNLLWT